MDNHDELAIATLGKLPGLGDPALVRTYYVHRVAKGGKDQMVTVKVFDHGPAVHPDSRFDCSATSDDGKGMSGNSARTIDAALAIAHWFDLD